MRKVNQGSLMDNWKTEKKMRVNKHKRNTTPCDPLDMRGYTSMRTELFGWETKLKLVLISCSLFLFNAII